MSRFGTVAVALLAFFVAVSAQAADSSLSLQANQAFLAANLKKPGVIQRPSGLQYKIIQNGYGKQPGPFDSVDVYYTGTLINGKVFDKTEQGLPASFVVDKLIPGWAEALEIMREGDHWQLVIPANLAYGPRGMGGVIPPNQTLVFDLELVNVTPAPKGEQSDQDQSSQ
ncbi:MAG: FKBP-type peptidyl-prolyl cis-trans isomerase [Rhizomicrobium sp.]